MSARFRRGQGQRVEARLQAAARQKPSGPGVCSSRLLATVQTSHVVDKAIAALISKDTPSLASLAKWATRGSPVLRVNATGILAKVGSPALDNEVVQALRADQERCVTAT